jgi:hypothetical protein
MDARRESSKSGCGAWTNLWEKQNGASLQMWNLDEICPPGFWKGKAGIATSPAPLMGDRFYRMSLAVTGNLQCWKTNLLSTHTHTHDIFLFPLLRMPFLSSSNSLSYLILR